MRVLIADADAAARTAARRVAEEQGHQAVDVSDGIQAWEAFDAEPFRIVLTDAKLPRLDGLALCRKIRHRPDTDYAYFILLTAGPQHPLGYVDAVESGADDLVAKPIDPDVLFVRLRVAQRILGLTTRVKELEGVIPICAHCRRIRGLDGRYETLENYLQEQSDARFSHGICPDCLKKHY